MTLERFTEIWDTFGFKFECGPELQKALIKMSNGDSSDFDEIERVLKDKDSKTAKQ